jgi:ribonuclease Z
MKKSEDTMPEGLTRRELLKGSGLALGGLAIGGALIGAGATTAQANEDCECPEGASCTWTDKPNLTQRYSYFEKLKPFYPFDKSTKTTISRMGKDEMRITFMGSVIPMNIRKAQQEMSVFVEVGWDEQNEAPLDQFIFDCGIGVSINYNSMNVNLGRMNKIFINHLHGDHMSDLTHMYCFGPSHGRTSPLYVFGPGNSGVESPAWGANPAKTYDDGTKTYCENLRRACRWHTESFSFQTTSYSGYPTQQEIKDTWGLPCMPVPVEDDPWGDSYAMVPVELDWENGGVAYNNTTTGARVTYFPVIHARRGSVGYKLEWWPTPADTGNPDKFHLTMIYSSDTKPEYNCVEQAINGGKGVDVFIHEMIVPAQVWAMKMGHLDYLPGFNTPGVQWMTMVQNSSHSPQGAFGFLLSLLTPRPRLTVATHFPVANDTVACAMKSVKEHCNVYQGKATSKDGKNPARITWSFDLMVIKVTKDEIVELRGEVSDFEFSATVPAAEGTPNPAKYSYPSGTGNPFAQIKTATAIPSCEDGKCNYREDGY